MCADFMLPLKQTNQTLLMRTTVLILSLLLFPIGVLGAESSKKTDNNTNMAETLYVEKVDTGIVTVYYPQFTEIDLACRYMPTPETHKDAIFVCEAAFTGDLIDKSEFRHYNIAGDHVSGGVYYRGYRCGYNTGTFVFDGKNWKFIEGVDDKLLKKVAKKGGMAFSQVLIVHDGKKQKLFRNDSHIYRALSSLNGSLCLIESKESVQYADFVDALVSLGVSDALYLDMGKGWNYAWYRPTTDSVEYLHKPAGRYTTNWITFMR